MSGGRVERVGGGVEGVDVVVIVWEGVRVPRWELEGGSILLLWWWWTIEWWLSGRS